MTVRADFDSKVIIRDEPIELPANQRLIVRIEPVAETGKTGEESALTWLAAHAVDHDTLQA
jgi:hypothetical protein